MRQLDARELRALRGMAVVEIEDVVADTDRARLLDEVVGDLAHAGELLGRDGVFDQQVAVLVDRIRFAAC